MTRPLALAASLALALTSAGCGSADPDAEVADVLRGWFRDLADGDGAAACSRLSPNAQRQFLDSIEPGAALGCERGVARLHGDLTPELRDAFRAVRVHHVDVRGDRAAVRDEDVEFVRPAVRAAATESPAPVVFRRIDGRWRVEDLG